MLTLKQIEALYWIAQLGTFERAAAQLHTTQSAISKRVQELEQVSGVPLFDRRSRTARLTPKGEQLFGLAKDMLALQGQVLELKHADMQPDRLLRLGITELTALTWLPRLIGAVRDKFSRVTIETDVGMSRDLFDRLLEDKLDVLIVPRAFSDKHVVSVPLSQSRNAWMCSPTYASGRGRLSMAELSRHTLLVQGNRSGTGLWVSNWLKTKGVAPPNVIASDSLIALLGMAVAGLGVTYLPRDCFRPLIAGGKLKIIPTDPELPPIPYVAMYRSDRPNAFTSRICQLAKMTCDFSQQLQGPHS